MPNPGGNYRRMPDRILITGGAGFVGSAIALATKSQRPGAHVIAFDNLRRRGSELNLPRLKDAGIEFVHGDIRQPADLASIDADLLIECSAEPSAQAGYGQSPDYVVQTNLVGCYNCLELARRCRADFLFLSTSRVYPVAALNSLHYRETATRFEWLDRQDTPGVSSRGISEAFSTQGARSIYGMTKLAAELMIEEFGDAYGLRCIVNRCGLIAGPWQMGKSDQGVVTLWMAAHHFGRPLRYIGYGGEGKQVRDILHIDDLVDLVALQTADVSRYAGRTFNAGGGAGFSLSLREMTALCQEISGRHTPITPDLNERRADLRIYVTDGGALQQASGWQPRRDPRTTLIDIHRWIRDHHNEVERSLFAPAA